MSAIITEKLRIKQVALIQKRERALTELGCAFLSYGQCSYHPEKETAKRREVIRAIDKEMEAIDTAIAEIKKIWKRLCTYCLHARIEHKDFIGQCKHAASFRCRCSGFVRSVGESQGSHAPAPKAGQSSRKEAALSPAPSTSVAPRVDVVPSELGGYFDVRINGETIVSQDRECDAEEFARSIREALELSPAQVGSGPKTPNERHSRCPQCNCRVRKLSYPGGMLNAEQWDSVRAGDWICDVCPPNGRSTTPMCYWWENEIVIGPDPLATSQSSDGVAR